MAKFSILIPAWKGEHVIPCLETVLKNSKDAEVYVLDNAQDPSRFTDIVADNFHLVHSAKNIGWVEGVNRLMDEVETEYVVVMNDDVIVTDEHWLEKLASCFKDDTGIVAACADNISGLQQQTRSIATDPIEVAFMVGFCFMMKSKLAHAMSPLLDTLFVDGNADDVDLSIRVREKGLKVLICPFVFHKHLGSQSYKARFKEKELYDLIAKNNKLLVKKWGAKAETTVGRQVLGGDRETFVAVPSASGLLPVDFVRNLIPIFCTGDKFHFVYTERVLIDRARNEMIRAANAMNVEHLFFADTDTIPPLGIVEAMKALDKDIVAPAIPDRNGEKGLAIFDEDLHRIYELKETRKVGAVGMACTLIKRRVIRAMCEKYDRPFLWCDGERDGEFITIGEDVHFCQLARQMGFEVWAIHGFYPEHIGNNVRYQYSNEGVVKKLLAETH